MDLFRRRFLRQSLAVAAAPAARLPAATPHLVLLGDSTLDNGAYTGGKPDVLAQLQRILPPHWSASLAARDGATIKTIPAQLARRPARATHLLLSVGGNDALAREGLLDEPAGSVAAAIIKLADAVDRFEALYRELIATCLKPGLPLALCTIYNANFADARRRRAIRAAVALFDDAIVRVAVQHKLKVIDLRLVCARPEDYANQIEPSGVGAAKIARAIAAAVTNPADGQGALLLGPAAR
jgi:hypothetical protein